MRSVIVACVIGLFLQCSAYNMAPISNHYLDTLEKRDRRKERRIRKSYMTKKPEPFNITNPPTVFMNASFLIPLLRNMAHNSNNDDDDDAIGTIRRPKKRSKEKTSINGNFHIQDVSRFNFSTIGGYNGIKNELTQMMDMIENPGNYTQYNVRLPKGVLLYGPPGNGKTLLARCFAGESKLSIIATSGSEFQEKYVGTGPARIRELFDFARDWAPCMVFIDEIDAVARRRGTDTESSQAERDSTLNQLLVELDGFDSFLDEKIMVMASTNRIDILDPALIRPGRIDKKIMVPLPDTDTRREIIKIHVHKKPIDSGLEWMSEELTRGLSGAEIEHLFNEATLAGIRNKKLPVTSSDLERTREFAIVGQNAHDNVILNDRLAFRVAVHELGHVLVAINSSHHDNPKKCTIDSPSSKMLGYTLFPPVNDTLMTMNSINDHIKVLLGGRAAEEVMFGLDEVSTGAADDLHKCAQMAHDMVLTYGMGQHIIYPRLSDVSKEQIDVAVFTIVTQKYIEVRDYLLSHKELLQSMGRRLVKTKSLDIDDILKMMREYR